MAPSTLPAWLPAGITIDDLVAAMAGLAAFLALTAIFQTLRLDRSFARRLKAIGDRRQLLRASGLAARGQRSRPRPTQTGIMHRVVQQLNLLRSREAAEAQLMLARAGFRTRDAMVVYFFCRVSLPFAFGLAAALDLYLVPILPVGPTWQLPVLAGAIIAGMFAPGLSIKNKISRRRDRLLKALPDGLDLLVICVEAGLTLDAALARVGRELGLSWPELAEEFALTAVELAFLLDRCQALRNLGLRTDLAPLRGVINTLQQAEKFGTPLANSLRVLSTEFRDTRMIKAEEKAARLPALLTVPMMIFILPVLFIVLLGPAALNAYSTLMH
jgi:tight adherence protein C